MCSKVGCDNPGTLRPAFLLRPKGYHGEPVELHIDVVLCSKCVEEKSTAEDYITDRGWMQIIQTMNSIGMEGPARDRTRVRFEEIDDNPF